MSGERREPCVKHVFGKPGDLLVCVRCGRSFVRRIGMLWPSPVSREGEQ